MRRLLRWLPAIAWAALISYWSSQSTLPIDRPEVARLFGGAQHPLAHASAFAILAALLRYALHGTRGATPVAWLLAAAFGAIDEWHQSFTPGRAVEVADWLVDASAAGGAALVTGLGLEVRSAARRAFPAPRRVAPAFGAAMLATMVLVGVVAVGPTPRVPGRIARAVEWVVPDRVERFAVRAATSTVDVARQAKNGLRSRVLG